MKTGSESFEKIFDALNKLYKKADDILFEVEVLATEIREKLKETEEKDGEALAEEALEDERRKEKEAEKAAVAEASGELNIF